MSEHVCEHRWVPSIAPIQVVQLTGTDPIARKTATGEWEFPVGVEPDGSKRWSRTWMDLLYTCQHCGERQHG